MLNTVKSVLADVSSVSPSSEQRFTIVNQHTILCFQVCVKCPRSWWLFMVMITSVDRPSSTPLCCLTSWWDQLSVPSESLKSCTCHQRPLNGFLARLKPGSTRHRYDKMGDNAFLLLRTNKQTNKWVHTLDDTRRNPQKFPKLLQKSKMCSWIAAKVCLADTNSLLFYLCNKSPELGIGIAFHNFSVFKFHCRYKFNSPFGQIGVFLLQGLKCPPDPLGKLN